MTTGNVPCVFPLYYGGKTYYSNCVGAWCGTTPNYDTDGQSGACLVENECPSYTTLSDPWRNVGFNSTSFSGFPKCDSGLSAGWYRFSGVGGDILADFCVPEDHGGSHTSLWVSQPLPQQGEGVKTLQYCASSQAGCCDWNQMLSAIYCPGGFYLYFLQPTAHCSTFATLIGAERQVCFSGHSYCTASSCGSNTHCTIDGGCVCNHGYRTPAGFLFSGDTYGCVDIDECTENPSVCGPNANCRNTVGAYNCSCHHGYRAPPGVTLTNDTHYCQDVDECQENSKICGQNASCSNTMGSYTCQCDAGFIPHPKLEWEKDVTTCKDIDECTENPSVCGPNANCSNTVGAYNCSCHHGNRAPPGVTLTNDTHYCQDVDECQENSKICGPNASCSNTMGSYTCQCDAGFIPHPKLEWEKDVTTCKDVTENLGGECEGFSEKECYLKNLLELIENTTAAELPQTTAVTLLNATLSTLDQLSQPEQLSRKGRRKEQLSQTEQEETLVRFGDAILRSSEKLVSTQVETTPTQANTSIRSLALDALTFSMGPKTTLSKETQLSISNNSMDIDLPAISKNNNGSAAVVFMTYTNMEDVLKAELFYTENDTIKTMMSNVVTASVVKTKNTTLPKPVNFTLKHQREMHPKGQLTCVYWNDSSWSVDGCEATETNTTHTVCTCAHLSTFALIMQTDKPPEDDSLLELITMVALSVGLACLALAILTFIFCTWNPKVNNTARLNLSICLFLAHLLLLLVQKFVHLIRPLKRVCSVLAGIQHFLFLSSFVWMYLEALQLFLLVRRLREVKVIHHESVHWGYLLLIGYGIPCLVVSMSAGLFPDGYGNEQCWLKTERGFKWSFLGPVCYILTMNIILFTGVIGSLRATLADLNREISLMRDTRVMVFKALVQFVILGCPWVLGFFVKNNKILEYLFILSVSQQGTFIFLVHCVLNKEVRLQYKTWWNKLSSNSSSTSSSAMLSSH
ncbi:hypothetical protein AGOR_G00195900 [Albula goreensis]|uniref:Uncharacterized protein n=1 Tax=Albula goreensis TaxID=1534307 RepID=A0A8T3CSA9_9TELE|nr:hypothetical protein AGOR_G00195900 [Albula goreensis]